MLDVTFQCVIYCAALGLSIQLESFIIAQIDAVDMNIIAYMQCTYVARSDAIAYISPTSGAEIKISLAGVS